MDVFKLIEKRGIELHGEIEYFAELVRADERERCAKIALSGTGEPVQVATLEILRKERERIAANIMEIER